MVITSLNRDALKAIVANSVVQLRVDGLFHRKMGYYNGIYYTTS